MTDPPAAGSVPSQFFCRKIPLQIGRRRFRQRNGVFRVLRISRS
nr:MAG TPA: hypothetical protein [Caudoviricetes sp.]